MNAASFSLTVSLFFPFSAAFAQEAPAALPSAPQPDTRFKTIDTLLAEIRLRTAEFEIFVGSAAPALQETPEAGFDEVVSRVRKGLEEKCRTDFSLDALLDDKPAFPIDSMIYDLQHYHLCDAFSRRNPDSCKGLALYRPKNPHPRMRGDCLHSYTSLIIAYLNISGQPDAAKVCEALPFLDYYLEGLTPRDECSFQMRKADARCKSVLIEKKPAGSAESEDCVLLGILTGDGSVCRLIPDGQKDNGYDKQICLDTAAYRKAFRAKDASLCGDFLVCRMLMGEKICDRYLARVREEFCRLWTQENLSRELDALAAEQESSRKHRSDVMESLKQRRAQIDDLFVRLGDFLEAFTPKSEPSYVARRDSYRVLGNKFDRSLRAVVIAPAGDEHRLQAIDALLAEIQPMMAEFEEFLSVSAPELKIARVTGSGGLVPQKEKELLRRCSGDFSIDEVIGGKTTFPIDSMMWDLRRYHDCEAFTRRKPDLCKELAGYRPQTPHPNMEAGCRDSYNRYTVAQLNITGRPDAAKICETLSFSSLILDGEGPEVECAFETAKPDPECKNVIIRKKPAGTGELEDCILQSILNGEGSVCAQIDDQKENGYEKKMCQDTAAYRRAFHAKDAGRCGDSLVCRMLMGEKICSQHLAKVRLEFCRLWAQEKQKDSVSALAREREAALKRGSEIMEALKQHRARVDAIFIKLGTLLEGIKLKSDQGYVSRLRAYKLLSEKFDRMVNELSRYSRS